MWVYRNDNATDKQCIDCFKNCRDYITSIMTKGEIGVIVVTVRKQSGLDESRKEKIMATVNFAANGFAYYLHSEH